MSREFISHYEPIEGTIELTRHLKRNGYRLAILSDTIPNHADVAKKRAILMLSTIYFYPIKSTIANQIAI